MHATRPKNIQIEYSFFLDLISYVSDKGLVCR